MKQYTVRRYGNGIDRTTTYTSRAKMLMYVGMSYYDNGYINDKNAAHKLALKIFDGPISAGGITTEIVQAATA